MSWIGDLFGDVNKGANSINPFKGFTDWSTANTIKKIPVIGKPLGQLADWGDSHPAQVGAVIGAAFGGAAALGGTSAGGGGGVVAGGGAEGLGGLGTTSGFGGVGVDAGATGFGSWGTSAGGADVSGLAGLDSGAVDAEGAVPGLTDSYGSASTGGFDWQGMLKNQLQKQLTSSGSSSGSSSGGGSSGSSDNSTPDYFSSLFTFGPGSVSTKTDPATDYADMLMNGQR